MENNADTVQWHAADAEFVIGKLGSSFSGLTESESKNRLNEYGPNQILRKSKDGWVKVMLRQINNPLIWVLIGSGTIATLIGKVTDGIVVLSVVVVNTIIGFIQEFKAGKAIEALSKMVPQNAAVYRNGRLITIPVSTIVPGDIVVLTSGDRVPADMRLLITKNLQVDESALTGESVPVQKLITAVAQDVILGDRTSMVYSGTLVTAGTATAIVTGTGTNTELGRISDMLNEATDLETPLTKKLATVGKYITIGVLAVTVIIMIAGTLRATGQGVLLGLAIKDSLIFAIALAVGAIPEGLPAVVTIALAIGVQRMAKRKAIIRKLPAVETLGSTTVICSDKTGTLTRNEMTVTETWTAQHTVLFTGTGYSPVGKLVIDGIAGSSLPEDVYALLLNAALCNDAGLNTENEKLNITGDPTEVALLVAASKAGIDIHKMQQAFPRIDSIPFDSENQYMVTLNGGKNKIAIIKGAPEVVINKCDSSFLVSSLDKQLIHAEIEKMGNRGMRVLAVAQKQWSESDNSELVPVDIKGGFSFIGLIGMIDPPRPEAIEAIRACHTAGIEVKMITGDHPTTALAIGMELGLTTEKRVVSGVQLSKMDDTELEEIVKFTNIFARVAPEHKMRLVKALQRQGHIVAMTGDGVNDAPSLKQSNIGVAMGITGTSVSKESSDIILTDDNFSSIAAAVEEGRRVYDNLVKSFAFLLPTNLGLALTLIWGIMFFPFNPITNTLLLPMLPTQLLWINLIAAITLALPLAFEAKEPNIMNRPPRKPGEPLFNSFLIFRVLLVSVFMTVGTIILFKWQFSSLVSEGIAQTAALSKAQTIAVTFVIMFQIFYMISCRSLKDSLLKIGLFSNKTVFIGIGAILVLQAFFVYLPIMQKFFGTSALSAYDIAVTVFAGFLVFPLIGLEKWNGKRIARRKLT